MGSVPNWEDPTCCRAAKPVCHHDWACALESGESTTTEPSRHNCWSPRTLSSLCSTQEEPPQWEGCTQQPERGPARHNQRKARGNGDPAQPNITSSENHAASKRWSQHMTPESPFAAHTFNCTKTIKEVFNYAHKRNGFISCLDRC